MLYSRARVLADDLNKRFSEHTSVQFNYLPTLRAVLALHQNDFQKAVELLQASARYDLAVPAIDFYFFFGGLYPVYVRIRARRSLSDRTAKSGSRS
jgi:eukaryotic-like serine/threonine-protein kinase